MRIKKFLAAVCFFSLLSTYALTIDNKPSTPNISKWARSQGSTVGVVIDFHGNVLPTVNASQSIGTSTETWSINASNLFVSSGLIAVSEEWESIPVPSSATHSRGMSFLISTVTLANQGTTYTSVDITQSTVPRNVVGIVELERAGTSTNVFVCSVLVTGWDSKGFYNRERISISTVTGDTADQPIGSGNIAWLHIDSFTVTLSSKSASSAGTVYLMLGTSNQIGLLADVDNSSDVVKILEGQVATRPNTAPQSGGSITTVNTVYDTVSFGSSPGVVSQRKKVWYRTKRNN